VPISKEQLYQVLVKGLPNAIIEINDLVGDENHYSITVTDSVFVNKNRVGQHKIVNDILKDLLKNTLHAVQIKTIIPKDK
jgi:stress-induced morphogen